MPPAPKASTAVSAVPRAERAEEDVPEAVELPEALPMDLDTLIEDYNTRAQVFETDATAFNPRIEAFNQQAQALDADARGLQALLEENPDGFSPGEEYDRALKTREALLERETALTTLQEQLSADQTRLGEEERQLNQLLEKIQLQEKEVAAKAWEHELPGSWEELADDHAAVVFVRMWDGLPLEDAKKEAYEKLKGIYAKKYAKPSRAKAATMLMAASADRQAALEELDVRSFVFKLGTSSSADTTDQIIQKHVKSLGLEAPPSAQTFKDTLTAAGINLEHLEQKIRVDNQNPAAVLHLETIRGGAVLQGVGPELVDRVNAVREGVARIEAQDKYIRTGDINTMMELDDPSFKFTEKDDSLAMGLNVVPGDAKFTDAQMIAASILLDKSDIGQQKRQVWEEYSGLLSHASTDNFVDAMTQIYARQFKLEAGAPNHEEKIQYFRERALRDVGALYVTGNWSGNRSISDRQLKGYQGDLLFGDALEQRIEVVGFDTDGEVLLRAVDGWMGGFEIVDIAHSGVAGVVREGSLGAGWSELFDPRDPSTSWDNFSTAWKRGMAQRDNTQQVGLDVIGSSPNMDTFDQLAWYLGGTAGWILTPDMITVAVGSLGRVVKKGLETPRRADLKKASKDFRIIAESRLNRTEEFAEAESRLRSQFPGQGDVADMLDIQEQLIAKRLSKQHPDIVDMDLAAKVPRGLNLSTGNRKAGVLMGEQAGTVATRYDELFNHPRHAQDLEDFAQKIKRGEIDPASDAVDKIADDLAESFSKRVAKKGATEEEVAAAKEKALAAIKAHPDDPAALQQSLMRFLENEVTTLKRLPDEPVAPKAPEPVKEPVEEPIKVTVDEAAWAQGGPTLLAKAAKESDEALSEALGFYRKRIARGEELEDFHKFNIRAIQEERARRAAAPKPKVKAPKKPKLSDLEKQALKAGKARQKKRDSFIPAIEKMVAELSKTMDKALSKEELLEVIERAKAAVWINNEARAIAAAQMHYFVEGKLGKRVKPIKVRGFRDVPELDPRNPMSFEAIDFMDQAIDAGYSAKKAEKIARMLDDYAINHGNTYGQDPKAWWLKHDIKIVKGKIQIVDGKPTFKLKKRPPKEKAPEKAEEPDVLLQRAEEITDTPEFKRWFGDSKVVDEKGKPLVVYHGTSAVFKDFSLSALGSAHGETTIRGLFFTPSPERASAYAVQTRLVSTKEHKALVKEVGAAKAEEIELSDLLDDLLTGQAKGSKWSKLIEDWGSVIPAHLRIERPFVFDAKGRHWSRELDHEILRGIEIAEGNFDGIHIKNIKDGEGISDNFIVFEATQIKSPFADPDVLFQGADAAKAPTVLYSGADEELAEKIVAQAGGEMGIEVNKARLVELLGSQMYSRSLSEVTVKELIQNSFDAIKEAEFKGVLEKGAGRIIVRYDPTLREIALIDNGIGMSPDIVQDAFFTVAGTKKDIPIEMRSGGFGIAKLGFLLGAESISLRTIRDGVLTTAEVSAKQMQDSIVSGTKFPVSTTKADSFAAEVAVVKKDAKGNALKMIPDRYDAMKRLQEDNRWKGSLNQTPKEELDFWNKHEAGALKLEHGTEVRIRIPEEYYDAQLDETRKISYPYKTVSSQEDLRSLPVPNTLSRNALIHDASVEVHFLQGGASKTRGNEDWTYILPPNKTPLLGRSFDRLGEYEDFVEAEFSWGSAQVWISKKKHEKAHFARHQNLSAGLFQFNQDIQSFSDKTIPYDIFIDWKPTVDPSHRAYPFNKQREGFNKNIKKDLDALKFHIRRWYAAQEAVEIGETFSSFRPMPLRQRLLDRLEDIDGPLIGPKLTPPKVKDSERARLLKIWEGKLEAGKGKTLTSENINEISDSFRVGAGGDVAAPTKIEVPKGVALFHNNTNVNYFGITALKVSEDPLEGLDLVPNKEARDLIRSLENTLYPASGGGGESRAALLWHDKSSEGADVFGASRFNKATAQVTATQAQMSDVYELVGEAFTRMSPGERVAFIHLRNGLMDRVYHSHKVEEGLGLRLKDHDDWLKSSEGRPSLLESRSYKDHEQILGYNIDDLLSFLSRRKEERIVGKYTSPADKFTEERFYDYDYAIQEYRVLLDYLRGELADVASPGIAALADQVLTIEFGDVLKAESLATSLLKLSEPKTLRFSEADITDFYSSLGSLNDEVKRLTQIAAKGSDEYWVYDRYKDIADVPTGISIDKEYAGVHIRTPFHGFFVNPLNSLIAPKNPRAAARQYMFVLQHELVHFPVSGHGESFSTGEMQLLKLLSDLDAYYEVERAVEKVFEKHWDLYRAQRKAYESDSTANLAKGLEPSDYARVPDPRRGADRGLDRVPGRDADETGKVAPRRGDAPGAAQRAEEVEGIEPRAGQESTKRIIASRLGIKLPSEEAAPAFVVPTDAASYEGRMTAGRVVFDSKEGLGQVPLNMNVAYKGFVAWMTPKEFLSLNPARPAEAVSGKRTISEVTRRIEAGEAIAPPFLMVKEDSNGLRVVGHEGRGRMMTLAELQPDTPIPVHIFGRGNISRARDLDPEMLRGLVDLSKDYPTILPDLRREGLGQYRGAATEKWGVKPRATWHVPSGDR